MYCTALKVYTCEEAASGPKTFLRLFCKLLEQNEPSPAWQWSWFQYQLTLMHIAHNEDNKMKMLYIFYFFTWSNHPLSLVLIVYVEQVKKATSLNNTFKNSLCKDWDTLLLLYVRYRWLKYNHFKSEMYGITSRNILLHIIQYSTRSMF
jgi:hypothetical protein